MKTLDRLTEIITKRVQSIEKEISGDFPEDYKKQLSIEEAVFTKIKGIIDWQKLTDVEKQTQRLITLASMRKSGALQANLKKQEEAIRLVEQINYTLPYIKVINTNNRLIELENLCYKEIGTIDLSGSSFRMEHVGVDEINNGFKSYFEKVQPYKLEMYKECYIKIEELHLAFKKLYGKLNLKPE